jgi:hypothetical protein
MGRSLVGFRQIIRVYLRQYSLPSRRFKSEHWTSFGSRVHFLTDCLMHLQTGYDVVSFRETQVHRIPPSPALSPLVNLFRFLRSISVLLQCNALRCARSHFEYFFQIIWVSPSTINWPFVIRRHSINNYCDGMTDDLKRCQSNKRKKKKANIFYRNTIGQQQFIQFCVDRIDGILSSEAYPVARCQITGFLFYSVCRGQE